jgi:hypothetical protein
MGQSQKGGHIPRFEAQQIVEMRGRRLVTPPLLQGQCHATQRDTLGKIPSQT